MSPSTQCYKCQKEISVEPNQHIGRREECSKCLADLRCCRMCGFYDVKAYNECAEPMAPRILEKEKANFCDYYKLTNTANNKDNKDGLISAANALFKD